MNSFTERKGFCWPKTHIKEYVSSTVSALQKYPCGILCDGQDRQNLLEIETYHIDTNVKAWAERNINNF